jgi:hypothetical protein
MTIFGIPRSVIMNANPMPMPFKSQPTTSKKKCSVRRRLGEKNNDVILGFCFIYKDQGFKD